jgi:hypothetical protein
MVLERLPPAGSDFRQMLAYLCLTDSKTDPPLLLAHSQRLLAGLLGGQVSEAASALQAFLGAGPGLTPSGDDLVIGLLLALNRWGDWLAGGFDIPKLSRLTSQAARQKTTGLSADLITCAGNGIADERLIAALDGLMTGDPSLTACAEMLLAWGASSGVDSLLGMGLAIRTRRT